MKRFLFCIIFISLVSFVSAQARYWVGASGGLWSATSNWSATSGGAPGASSPITANDVIFNNGFNGVVDMDVLSTTTFTINSLKITANSTVTLQRTQPAGGTRVFQLASTSTSTKGLQIDNGSTLIIDAVNTTGTLDYTLALTGGMGVTGEISGNLFIKATGAGAGGTEMDLSDDATHFAVLIVKNLGVIKYFDDTDNTSPSTGSYLTMESGSTYEIEKNGGSFPIGTWDPNSLAKAFNATGANSPTFSGTTYGNLEWNCPNQNSYTLVGDLTFNNVNLINTNGGTAKVFRIINTTAAVRNLTINGNLTVSNNSILEITGATTTAPGGGRLHLKGNLNNSGTITTTGATGTINQLELNGSSNQNITNTGTLSGARLVLTMNNAAGATLLSPLSLTSQLQLDIGKIKTDAVNILTMGTGSSWTGGNSASFIEGPMRRTGTTGTSYTMPIGKGSIYAYLIYRNSLNYALTDTLTGEYFRSNPQSTYGTNYDPIGNPEVINHISFTEYWRLVKNAGSTTPGTRVVLTVTDYSFCTNLSTTFAAVYDAGSSQWKNCGTIARNVFTPGPFYATGEIEAIGTAQLGAFTLATSDNPTTNPLPISLITFDATKLTNTKSSINWELAACCSATAKFEIEKANGNNRSFSKIAIVNGSTINKGYNYIDTDLKNGINYYRLKMIDEDGKITYSRIVAVMNGVNGLMLTSLIPTVITDNATLTIASSNQQKLDFVIVDMQGRLVLRRNYTIALGNTNIELPLNSLASGIYQLTGISAEGKTNTIRFVKQ